MDWRHPFKKRVAKTRIVYATPPAYRGIAEEQDKRIQTLESTLDSLKSPFDRVEHLDKSRSKIAFKFVGWYFALILVLIIGVPLYNNWVGSPTLLELDKLLNQIGTLLGTPLGFVVGYYFKEEKRK
jgi:hypothetical protein